MWASVAMNVIVVVKIYVVFFLTHFYMKTVKINNSFSVVGYYHRRIDIVEYYIMIIK